MPWVGIRYELGQSVNAFYDEEGLLKAQHDGLGRNPKVGASDAIHPLGFAAKPRPTDVNPDGSIKGGGGCRLRIGHDGDELHVEFVGDHRDLARIPPLPAAGGAVMYAPGCAAPSFHVVRSDDGTHQTYVEVGDSAHIITAGLDGNGDRILELVHADGMAITMLKGSVVVKNNGGSAYLEINDSGVNIIGPFKAAGGADIGGPGSVPLTKQPALTPVLTAIQAALGTMTPTPATAAAMAALTAALATFATAGPTLTTKGA